MTFAHPYLLLLLLVLPLAAWLKGRRGQPPAFVYSSTQLLRGVQEISKSNAGGFLAALRWLALALFIIALSQRAGEGYIIEPVHNIFLLAGAELGLPGLLLVIVLFISITLQIIKTRSPQAILASATLVGLCIISLFDHYLWTLAPGRMMFGLALGLWAGQVMQEKTY